MNVDKLDKYLFTKAEKIFPEFTGKGITKDSLALLEETLHEELEKDGWDIKYIKKLSFQCRHEKESTRDEIIEFSFNSVVFERLVENDEYFVEMLEKILN